MTVESSLQDSLRVVLVTGSGTVSPPQNFQNIISSLVSSAAVTMIQLREKTSSTKDFFLQAQSLKTLLIGKNIPLLINDRIDIALAVDADGVHLGQADMPLSIARQLLGKDKIIGITCHTLQEALAAQEMGADYISCAAAFPTQTKLDAVVIGPQRIHEITQSVQIPCITIGGITLENAPFLLKECPHLSGFAVVSSIMNAKNPSEAAICFREIVDKQKQKITHQGL